MTDYRLLPDGGPNEDGHTVYVVGIADETAARRWLVAECHRQGATDITADHLASEPARPMWARQQHAPALDNDTGAQATEIAYELHNEPDRHHHIPAYVWGL